MRNRRSLTILIAIALSGALAVSQTAPAARQTKTVWSEREKPVMEQIRTLRSVPDAKRGALTRQLALEIRALPPGPNKMTLASGLADLSTEGDFGHDTLQDVAVTLADALAEQARTAAGMPEEPYVTLAQLVRYEHVSVPDSRLLSAATTKLLVDERRRAEADFTLNDLGGKQWNLRSLRGKVVLVNFWATWCPPCRKEMPDLQSLHEKFRERGLVILGISDEDAGKVQPFVSEHNYSYPILLDPGDRVNKAMAVDGIPKTFVYDREGKLVSQAMDMRTKGQLLDMLAAAGLK